MRIPENGAKFPLKQNRSNRFTTGLVCTFEGTTDRCFFFELDYEHRDKYQEVATFFDMECLDWLVHRTGGGGYHFISPTMVSKEQWIAMHLELKDINPKCPMTTLRMIPNKYTNEDMFWYNTHYEALNSQDENNNEQMCI